MITRLLLTGLLVCTVTTLFAQKKFSAEELRADADVLIEDIKAIHPNPFYQYAEADFMAEYEKRKESLTDSMTNLDFYRIIAPLIHWLNDGHTGLLAPRIRDDEARYFPFAVTIDAADYSIRVAESVGPVRIAQGTVIPSINGKPAAEIVHALLEYCTGETEYKKRKQLEQNFAAFYYRLYGENNFKILGNPNMTLQVGGVELKAIEEAQKVIRPKEPLTLEIDRENNYAVLGFHSCTMKPEVSEAFFKNAVDSLNQIGIQYLIVDTRYNGGGNSDNGGNLLKYLCREPFTQFDRGGIKFNPRIREFYHQYDYEYPDEWDDRLETEESIYTEFRNSSEEWQQPHPEEVRFQGECILLTGHRNFSSGTNFAWTFWKTGTGPVIGEETGGVGYCYGDIFTPTLPNTRVRYSVSHKLFCQLKADETSVHGVIPDVEIPYEEALDYTIQAIKDGSIRDIPARYR